MTLLFLLFIFISLFILYAVARHDFVLLRQSISLRQVYDNVFISLFFFFLFARVGYILQLGNLEIINPLKFFYLSKYWGILPYAGFVGLILTLIVLFRKKKNKLRILDIYILSFTPLILLDILLKGNSSISFLIKLVSLVVLIGFYGWFIKIHNKFTTKDGFITFLTIITYSLASLALSISSFGITIGRYTWLNIILLLVIVISVILLILVQRDFFNKQ